MAGPNKMCGYLFYSSLSVVFYFGEKCFSVYMAYLLYQADLTLWFVITTGLLATTTVTSQLVSATWCLQTVLHSCGRKATVITLHILQLALPWRLSRLLFLTDIVLKNKKEVSEICLLRVLQTFCCSLPLLFVFSYVYILGIFTQWPVIPAITTCLVSATWSLATYRRQFENSKTEDMILSWPGMFLKLTWRTGEIASRMASLALFSTLYMYWVFVVLGLHFLTMLLWLGVQVSCGQGKCKAFHLALMGAYMYTFCYFNIKKNDSKYRFVTFYIVMFLEDSLLLVVWVLNPVSLSTNYPALIIAWGGFIMAFISMAVLHRFFKVEDGNTSQDSNLPMCVQQSCINCKLSLCVKHSPKYQRPFNLRWVEDSDDGTDLQSLISSQTLSSERNSRNSSFYQLEENISTGKKRPLNIKIPELTSCTDLLIPNDVLSGSSTLSSGRGTLPRPPRRWEMSRKEMVDRLEKLKLLERPYLEDPKVVALRHGHQGKHSVLPNNRYRPDVVNVQSHRNKTGYKLRRHPGLKYGLDSPALTVHNKPSKQRLGIHNQPQPVYSKSLNGKAFNINSNNATMPMAWAVQASATATRGSRLDNLVNDSKEMGKSGQHQAMRTSRLVKPREMLQVREHPTMKVIQSSELVARLKRLKSLNGIQRTSLVSEGKLVFDNPTFLYDSTTSPESVTSVSDSDRAFWDDYVNMTSCTSMTSRNSETESNTYTMDSTAESGDSYYWDYQAGNYDNLGSDTTDPYWYESCDTAAS